MQQVDEQQSSKAKLPHDVFLTNLIVNHILLFTTIAATGRSYFEFMVLVPVISFSLIGYTLIRAARVKREDSEFVYIHWQIAKRWSRLFAYVLLFAVSISILGWLGYTYGNMMREMVLAMIAGLSALPVLVSVLILIIVEMDALHHARVGTLPEWAKKRFNVSE